MKNRLLSCFALLAIGALLGFLPVFSQFAQAKVLVVSAAVGPDRRAGTVYMNCSALAMMIGADVAWDAKARTARVYRDHHSAIFRVGNKVALVNGQRVMLPAAPYLESDTLMVPAKIMAKAFSAPLRLEERTDSVVVGPVEGTDNPNTVYVVPMLTNHTGFLVHSPKVGAMVPTKITAHLQANIPEGQELVLQLREADNSILMESVVRAMKRAPGQPKTLGRFSDHQVGLAHVKAGDNGRKVRFAAFMRKATRPAHTMPALPKGLPIQGVSVPVLAPPKKGE